MKHLVEIDDSTDTGLKMYELLKTLSKNDKSFDFVDEDANNWNIQQIENLNNSYSSDEPNYSFSMVKESNSDFEKR
jgi:hypothetical protein